MPFDIQLDGDFKAEAAAQKQRLSRHLRVAVESAMGFAVRELRSDVQSAGLGMGVARAWRGEMYPRRALPTLHPAALVFSRARKIVDAFERGVVIRSKNGFFLAIPTEAAGKSTRGGRISPGEWERRHGTRLRFVYRRGRPSLLVADDRRAHTGRRTGFTAASRTAQRTGRGLATVPIFILVPQTTLRKRLDVDGIRRRTADFFRSALTAGGWE